MDFTRLIMYLVFFGGGLFMIVNAFLQKSKASKAAESWQKTQGVVQSSELSVRHRPDSDGSSSTQYYPRVVYNYQVKGTNYTNNALTFGKANTSKKKANLAVAKYPAGASVQVYYDPADPTKSVLETEARGFVGNLLMGVLLIVVGVVTIIFL